MYLTYWLSVRCQHSRPLVCVSFHSLPELGDSVTPPMKPINVLCPGVVKLLRTLKLLAWTVSQRGFSSRRLSIELASAVTLLFQAVLNQGRVPSLWKEAMVIPIVKKKGNHSLAANDRPISLTSILSKLCEHIIIHIIIHVSCIYVGCFWLLPALVTWAYTAVPRLWLVGHTHLLCHQLSHWLL